jgi:hypothetical protein
VIGRLFAASVVTILVAACGTHASVDSAKGAFPSHGGSPAGSSTNYGSTPTHAGPCQAGSLRARGGRQGAGFGVAHADVEFTNLGSAPCTLSGPPTVTILRSDGSALPVQSKTASNVALAAVVLPPDVSNAAWLTLSWTNWCGPAPGSLALQIVLPADAGTLTASFNGPPDYDYLPACQSATEASVVEIQSGYAPPG